MKLVILPCLYSIKRFLTLIALGIFVSTASAVTVPDEDFENIGGLIGNGLGVTNFNVGTASFSGGVSGIARIFELYNSGNHAWMVFGGETGTIQLGPNTTGVSFYVKAFSGADEDSIITAFDGTNSVLKTMSVSRFDPSFAKFTVTGLIDRIEYTNNDSDNSRMNSLDDFSVTTVPVPAAFWLFGTAILGIIRLQKRRILS